MTTGNSAWNGLGMGLNGEYEMTQQALATDLFTLTGASSMSGDFFVCRSSTPTELMWINSKGAIYSRATADTSGNAYVGIDCRGEAAGTPGFVATSGFRLTHSSTTAGGWQLYPIMAYFVGDTGCDLTGGRATGINIAFNISTGYTGQNYKNMSFINFSDSSTAAKVPALFTFPGMTTANDIFDANVCTASTHSLKISIGDGAGNTAYYIMLTTCTA